MISVGKHPNLVISAITTSETSDLTVQFKQASEVKSRLAAMSAANVDSSKSGQTQDFKLWALKPVDWQGQTLSSDDIWKDIQKRQDLLTFILSNYMTSDKYKTVWTDAYKAVGITEANMDSFVTKADNLLKLTDAISAAFIKLMKPFVGDNGKKFYCVFPRSSAKSHFPKLRDKFLSDQPFMVPMDQPDLFAKADFTPYELGERKPGQPKGPDLSNPNKIEAAGVEASPEQEAAVANIFETADAGTENSDDLPF